MARSRSGATHQQSARRDQLWRYLGPATAWLPRLWVHQIQLTIADLVGEAHDTHHPLSSDLYYEDQKPEALRRAKHFREERIPRFLGWFEGILALNPEGPGQLVGSAVYPLPYLPENGRPS